MERTRYTHVLQTTTVGSQTLVEGDGVTLVVLPIGDTRRNHPLLLLLRGRLTWRTAKDRGRGTRRATGNLLVLEPWRLKRVLHNLSHLDDPLLQRICVTLLTRSVPNEGGLRLTIRDVLWLCRLDFAVHKLLQRRTGLLGRRLHLIFRRPLQHTLSFIQIFSVGERNEILEL